MGIVEWEFQTNNLLSLPPDASYYSSKLHFKPQTSCLCSYNFLTTKLESLKSLREMVLSLDPQARSEIDHESEPTLMLWSS